MAPQESGPIGMKITVDDALRSRLHDFRLPLELCDEAGKVLGYFEAGGGPKSV